MTSLTRRSALLLAGVPALAAVASARAQSRPAVSVTKDPDCPCCGGWVTHLRRSGFAVEVTESADMQAVKAALGVPDALASCHTAKVEGYVLEGHVPAVAIRRLLSERPAATGVAVPGMPVGSPGMESSGASPEPYDAILFGQGEPRPFGRYKGADAA